MVRRTTGSNVADTGRRKVVVPLYMYGNHSSESVKLVIQQVFAVPPTVPAVVLLLVLLIRKPRMQLRRMQ